MGTKRILILSDRRDALGAHKLFFDSQGFAVWSGIFAEMSDDWWQTFLPNIVVMDICRPTPNILSACQQLRMQLAQPILSLSSESDERFHIQLYQHGVDESIAKPIGTDLLIAKVNAWLARADVAHAFRPNSCRYGFSVNKANRRVITPTGNTVRLSKLEFELFMLFFSHPNRILEPDLIGRRVWDYDDVDSPNMVKNLIYRLRSKIEPNPTEPKYIVTTESLGYAFSPE